MKLFDSSSSPFVRKVNATIHALGLEDRVERLAQAAHPVRRDAHLVGYNPLGQVPTLVPDDGQVMVDSRVICEYLDRLANGRLFGADPDARWRALRLQAWADGLLDAAILVRYERSARPPEGQWSSWVEAQFAKVDSVLETIEREADGFGDRFDIGTLSSACALGYPDFRFADRPWRPHRPSATAWYERFSCLACMRATEPQERQ